MADAAEVVRVTEGHHTGAELPRPRNRHFHGLERDDLAIALAPVEGNESAAVEFRLGMPVGSELALQERGDVARDHSDSVRIVAHEIRDYEILRDELRLARLAAPGRDDRLDGARERFGMEDVGFGHVGFSGKGGAQCTPPRD
jgi:hypothetical protein